MDLVVLILQFFDDIIDPIKDNVIIRQPFDKSGLNQGRVLSK